MEEKISDERISAEIAVGKVERAFLELVDEFSRKNAKNGKEAALRFFTPVYCGMMIAYRLGPDASFEEIASQSRGAALTLPLVCRTNDLELVMGAIDIVSTPESASS